MVHCAPWNTAKQKLLNVNTECDHNRGGLLYGACATNYSLMLGGSQCQLCSNVYLAMLLPFAAAGIVLVAFLTALRLTVTVGSIKSAILLANIILANQTLLFNSNYVITVLLAWLNLDLGFQICFYDG